MELVKDPFIVILGQHSFWVKSFYLGKHFFFFEDNPIIHLIPSIIDVSDNTT